MKFYKVECRYRLNLNGTTHSDHVIVQAPDSWSATVGSVQEIYEEGEDTILVSVTTTEVIDTQSTLVGT